MECSVCGRSFTWSGRGRRPEVCGARCRKRKSRLRELPAVMRELPRWSARDGKRPAQVSGRAASSTDPGTWTTFEAVAAMPHGVMLGDGLACWDLDGVLGEDGRLHPEAAQVLAEVGDRVVWIERSMSGRGLHVFVWGEEARGVVGKHVSYYSQGRFIAVSHDAWPAPRWAA